LLERPRSRRYAHRLSFTDKHASGSRPSSSSRLVHGPSCSRHCIYYVLADTGNFQGVSKYEHINSATLIWQQSSKQAILLLRC
jgi:hypothetical protein